MATHCRDASFSWSGSIGQIHKFARRGMKWKACDATTLASDMMEFLPGRGDAGELSFSMRWHKTEFGTLHAAAMARTVATGTITMPDGSTWSCSAFVTQLDDDVPEDDVIVSDVTFKFTGSPTYTPAA